MAASLEGDCGHATAARRWTTRDSTNSVDTSGETSTSASLLASTDRDHGQLIPPVDAGAGCSTPNDDPARSVPDGGLQSLATALDILDYFEVHESLGVTELARRFHVSKSTAHRMLATMYGRGFVEKDTRTGRYRLGMRLYELGQAAADRSRIRRIALPLLEDLHHRTGQMVHMAVPDGADVLYLARLHTRLGAQHLGKLGVRFPAHVTSSGKVIAAFDADVASACRARGFPPLTASSIRTVSQFDQALDEVRRRGFAVNEQEAVSGWTSVAAAVKDRAGRPRAAVSLVGPSSSATSHIGSQARLVTVAATHLARMLGS